jgi:hypothetical protein
MEKVENARCIYVQKSVTQHTEKEMVRVVTLLGKYLDSLTKIVADVRDHKRVCDAQCCLEQFTLFNLCRNTTMELMDAIAVWQQGFTRVLRPILMEADYMIKLIKGADFFNATYLRRIFNFSLGSRNLLFLPMPNPRTIEPVTASYELREQIKQFAAPPIEKIIACYQMLINSLPRPIFSKILPIDVWLQNRWIPVIEVGIETRLLQSRHASNMLKKSDTKKKKEVGVNKISKLELLMSRKSVKSGKRSVRINTDQLSQQPAAATWSAEVLQTSNKFSDTDEDPDGEEMAPSNEVEDDVGRLCRLYVPREMNSLLDAYYDDMEIFESIALTESTSVAPPFLSEPPVMADSKPVTSVVDNSEEQASVMHAAQQNDNVADNPSASESVIEDDVSQSEDDSDKEHEAEYTAALVPVGVAAAAPLSTPGTDTTTTAFDVSAEGPKDIQNVDAGPSTVSTMKPVTKAIAAKRGNVATKTASAVSGAVGKSQPRVNESRMANSESQPMVGTAASALLRSRSFSNKIQTTAGKASVKDAFVSPAKGGAPSPKVDTSTKFGGLASPYKSERAASPTPIREPVISVVADISATGKLSVEQRAAKFSFTTSMFRQQILRGQDAAVSDDVGGEEGVS